MTVTEQPAGPIPAVRRRSAAKDDADGLGVELGSNDDIVIAALTGDLTAATAQTLSALVADLATTGQFELVLDCRRLYTVDPHGLAGLHDARKALERRGGSLTMTGVRPQVRAVLIRSGSAEKFGVSKGHTGSGKAAEAARERKQH
jgi:anti-anti-sigma factor